MDRKICCRYNVFPGKNYGALDNFFEFPYIPGIGLTYKKIPGFGGVTGYLFFILRPILLDKMAHKPGDILFSFPERRGHDGRHVHPVILVFLESALH